MTGGKFWLAAGARAADLTTADLFTFLSASLRLAFVGVYDGDSCDFVCHGGDGCSRESLSLSVEFAVSDSLHPRHHMSHHSRHSSLRPTVHAQLLLIIPLCCFLVALRITSSQRST